jgi:hypothetical protein
LRRLFLPRGIKNGVVQCGAKRCTLEDMAKPEKGLRLSVTIPAAIAKRVRAMAKARRTSTNRVLVDLLEAGLQFKDAEKERFLAMANQLAESSDPAERQRLQKELARITFGE